jgi:hypothetical protein
VNSCPEGTNLVDCGSVKLNFNAQGLDDTQSSQGTVTSGSVLSSIVSPIQLKNGWILAYDSGARNVLAFREEAPRTTLTGATVGFRTFEPTDGKANKNFGFGNGLVLSLVISGEDLAEQIRATSEPIVTRFVELERDKVLIFFSTVRAIHLLELEEVTTSLAWDLNDPENEDTSLPVPLLRGTIKLFPDPAGGLDQPFLTFRTISEELTGDTDVKVDSFQPIIVPTDGAALVFEQTTSQFIKVGAEKELVDDPDNPGEQIEAIVGSTAERAILGTKILSVLQEGVGGNVVSPPLDFRTAFYHQVTDEICFLEEKTNNLIAYDYTKGLSNNVRIFVGAESFLQPRGGSGGVAGAEPVLTWAVNDVTDNRLGFDQGLDQLLSVSYKASEVVVVASRLAITGATLNTLAALNYVEPLTSTDVRAFDNQSNSLILMRLTYATLPVKVK